MKNKLLPLRYLCTVNTAFFLWSLFYTLLLLQFLRLLPLESQIVVGTSCTRRAPVPYTLTA